jgi:hypothetical protein
MLRLITLALQLGESFDFSVAFLVDSMNREGPSGTGRRACYPDQEHAAAGKK